MKKVQTNDLISSMRLAGQNMLDCLNVDANYLPCWDLYVDREYNATYNFRWPAHNIGRWWDCMLRLEESIGYEIPPEMEAAMLENFKQFLDNEDHFCIPPEHLVDLDRTTYFEIHSMRETLLALLILIRRRNSTWARNAAHAMLETLDRVLNDNCEVDLKLFDHVQKHPDRAFNALPDPTRYHGRLLDALVPYYVETKDELAFRLAKRLAEWHYENSTREDGTITGLGVKHTHSYFGTLRGLLQFGLLTGERKYIDRVYKSYQVTVMQMVKESGFTSHDIGLERRPETSSPGDAAQLALWMALDGRTELLDDAERIVRARILPSQVLDTPPLKPTGNGMCKSTDLEKRILGGYGGMQLESHGGKHVTTDVTAGDIHSLVDIYNHIVVESDTMTRVFFHFAYENDTVSVKSVRENGRGTVSVESKTGKILTIRVPAWAPRKSLTLKVNGQIVKPDILNGFAYIETDGKAVSAELSYDLPIKEISETTEGVDYRIRFEGDEIIGISPNTDFYPLYPDLEQ